MDIYQIITEKILQQMEKGIVPWRKPWTGAALEDGGAINYVTRKPYSLINQYLLGKEGEWLSFKQIQQLNGTIKKGAESGMVVFYSPMVKEEEVTKPSGEVVKEQKSYRILRYYRVFHIDDIEGIKSKIVPAPKPKKDKRKVNKAEKIIKEYVNRELTLTFNEQISNKAYYSPALDMVVVPKRNQFKDIEEFYSTTFHELTHSTLHPDRCNRQDTGGGFGSESYSREELVAEMGAAMLCSISGVDLSKCFDNSVAYLRGWSKHLKEDSRAIIWAASRAEKAARYILGEDITKYTENKTTKKTRV